MDPEGLVASANTATNTTPAKAKISPAATEVAVRAKLLVARRLRQLSRYQLYTVSLIGGA